MFSATGRSAALLTLSLTVFASAAAARPQEAPAVPIPSAPTQGFDRKLRPWPAPVGHRQPRVEDIPQGVSQNASAAEQERLDRVLGRKLMICRGC
jgi:hypothetical protein